MASAGMARGVRAALAALAVAVFAGCAPSDPAADGGMLADANDWPLWGRTDGEQHYSPLNQINTNSVGRLSLAWHYDLPSGNSATGPLAADGKVFVTSGHSYIRALDAVTGDLLWEFDSHTRELDPAMSMGWGPRGIAYWNQRVFVTTEDGRIFALDANSGETLWETRDFGLDELRNQNGPPRVFDGKLIIGNGGADLSAIRGYVSAYDAMTGERVWRFYTVPDFSQEPENEAMRIAAATWHGVTPGQAGGGTAWNAFSYDPELDLVYIGVGNGFPYNQAIRSPGGGDNLFLASIVAVRADTGEYVWHYQTSPGEQWDHVSVMDMTLATLRIDGRERRVLMQAPKNGFFYVIDRETGEFISAEAFARVTWAERIDQETGRPVENPGARYHGRPGMFELWPGFRGAHSWSPQSFSPRTGLVYIPVIEGATLVGDEGIDVDSPTAHFTNGTVNDSNPDLPGARRSFLRAWDPVSQRERWSVELPGDWPGGTMATAGDLVFQGRIDGQFVAYNARSGREVWSFASQAPIVGPPISFSVDGRQYVTVITGNGATGGGMLTEGLVGYRTDYRLPRRVLTFALDGGDVLPPLDPMPPLAPPDDPTFRSNASLEARGAMVFAMNACMVCHGNNAVAGGAAPDLRTSPYPSDREAFHDIVRGGALQTAGMPRFDHIPVADAEALRQYLRARGQQIGQD